MRAKSVAHPRHRYGRTHRRAAILSSEGPDPSAIWANARQQRLRYPQEPTMTNGTSGSALPALNLAAMPGQRLATLELAREIERRGFAGISVASPFGTIGQCAGLAFATQRISFASAIAPIYAQTVDEFAQSAAYLHEVSAGRFQFGI